ncbi:MAG: type I-E CRISPR-associated protein Cas6/Cse3/CasE [Candidatus Nanopelagicales bacterium]
MEWSHATPHRLIATVSPYLRDVLVENRERAHSHVMSAFPRAVNDESPRSELGILWHLDHAAAVLTVQSRTPALYPGLLGDVGNVSTVLTPSEEARVHVRLFCNVQKTPPSYVPPELGRVVRERTGKAYRSRLVIVPEEERLDWAVRRLERSGLRADPATVTVGRVSSARLGRRDHNIPAAELVARATVYDATLLAKAIGNGVGKGKNYGLGLLRLDPIDRH